MGFSFIARYVTVRRSATPNVRYAFSRCFCTVLSLTDSSKPMCDARSNQATWASTRVPAASTEAATGQ